MIRGNADYRFLNPLLGLEFLREGGCRGFVGYAAMASACRGACMLFGTVGIVYRLVLFSSSGENVDMG